ncbi:hypothetical protein ACFRAR_25240 [Kitasatospora sp. NPDC056651]|uniref:hypothetical protein n=1 Tax=Kitasatospora sp. NPDC056651 TaxID=3345892 RepID=UPI0036959F84
MSGIQRHVRRVLLSLAIGAAVLVGGFSLAHGNLDAEGAGTVVVALQDDINWT